MSNNGINEFDFNDDHLSQTLLLLFDSEKGCLKNRANESIAKHICDLIHNQMVTNGLADQLMNYPILDQLFLCLHHLISDPIISNHLINAINLVFINGSTNDLQLIPEESLRLYVETINKSLEMALISQNDKFFLKSLSALKQLLIKTCGCGSRLMNEFSFFTCLNIFEHSLVNNYLFPFVVHFSSQLINESQIPDHIPINQLNGFLTKVVDIVQNMFSLTVNQPISTDYMDLCVDRLRAAFNLIDSYLQMIFVFKTNINILEFNEFQQNRDLYQTISIENSSIESRIEISENPLVVDIHNDSVGLISNCFRNLKKIFPFLHLINESEIEFLCLTISKDSQIICKNAIQLLSDAFDVKRCLRFNIQTMDNFDYDLNAEQIQNLSKLFLILQNAFIRGYISSDEMFAIFRKLLIDIKEISFELFSHLVHNPWFHKFNDRFNTKDQYESLLV